MRVGRARMGQWFSGPDRCRPVSVHAAGVGFYGVAGAVLLEVVISLGLLVFGMAMVGLQVRAGLDAARATDLGTRALMLTDTLLAELDCGAIIPDTTDEEVDGDFGIKAPGYTWRIKIEQADVENLYMLTMELGFNQGHVDEQIDDPDLEIDIEDDGTTIVRTVYRLYPKPADINMERDYGLASEDLEKLLGMSSGEDVGGQEGGGAAAAAGDLASVASEMGVDLSGLDFLLDPGGFDPRMLSQLPEEEFMQLIDLLDTVLPGGAGALSGLQDQVGPLVEARDLGGEQSRRESRRAERTARREERTESREEQRRQRAEERQNRTRRDREDARTEDRGDSGDNDRNNVRSRRDDNRDRSVREELEEEESQGRRRGRR